MFHEGWRGAPAILTRDSPKGESIWKVQNIDLARRIPHIHSRSRRHLSVLLRRRGELEDDLGLIGLRDVFPGERDSSQDVSGYRWWQLFHRYEVLVLVLITHGVYEFMQQLDRESEQNSGERENALANLPPLPCRALYS